MSDAPLLMLLHRRPFQYPKSGVSTAALKYNGSLAAMKGSKWNRAAILPDKKDIAATTGKAITQKANASKQPFAVRLQFQPGEWTRWTVSKATYDKKKMNDASGIKSLTRDI